MSSTVPFTSLLSSNNSFTSSGWTAERVQPQLTLARYADQWLATLTGRRVRTVHEYRYRLERLVLPRLGSLPIVEISASDILGLLNELETRGYAGWTVNSVALILKVVFKSAVREGVIAANPFDRIDRCAFRKPSPCPRRILNREEMKILIELTAEQHQPLLATALFTGLRQSEILALQWEHVDMIERVVHVRTALDRQQRHVPPKTTAAYRDVVLSDKLLTKLQQLRSESRFSAPSNYVFSSRVGTPLHWRNVNRRVLKPALLRAELGRVRWHDLRHTYASMLISGGSNILFVSRQLGHASPTITLGLYGDLFALEEQGDRARGTLDELVPTM